MSDEVVEDAPLDLSEVPCIVFETPGLMDLRSITLIGVNAKPNTDSPIGYFGTGLKYSIATLMRIGAEITIYIGDKRWDIRKSTEVFRGSEYTRMRIVSERIVMGVMGVGTHGHDLPYAMEHGRNWGPRMVFRELESNTRDEKGITYITPGDPGPTVLESTRIVVRHPDIVKAFEDRDSIFLPGHLPTASSGVDIQDKGSEYLYRRGVRAYKPHKSCLMTYNFLDNLVLTEDRTIRDEAYARVLLGQAVQRHDSEYLIEKILTCGKDYWEHDLIFSDYIAPSAAFHRVAMRHPKNLPPSFAPYYAQHDERITSATYKLADAHPGPWRLSGNTVYDKAGRAIFEAPYNYMGKWSIAADEIMRRLGYKAEEAPAKEPLEDDVPF